MMFDLRAMPASGRHKILSSTVLPRPIAWVVTTDPLGLVNVAPFSFFGVASDDPPLLMIGIGDGERGLEGDRKDTGRNIADRGQFVVCLVDHAHAPAMVMTAVNHPADVSEAEIAGLHLAASTLVQPPRIATAPVAFECRVHTLLDLPTRRRVVLGEVLAAHVTDQAVLDAERRHIDARQLDLIARMHGDGWYLRADSWFQQRSPRP